MVLVKQTDYKILKFRPRGKLQEGLL